jgi:hypothetical protein
MDRRRGAFAALAMAAALAGCGRPGGPDPAGGLSLSFEDRAAPAAFTLEAAAVRDRPDGAAGLWAAVRGLSQAERGLVVAEGDRRVVVALFPARPRDPDVRLSNAAADALGLGAEPDRVTVTALRRRPRLDTNELQPQVDFDSRARFEYP